MRRAGLVPGTAVLLLCASLGLAPGILSGQTPGAAFEAANRLYEQGKFGEAAAAYEKLTKAGQSSPALYYNQANAWFKAGQIGRAIAGYRRAEQLAPRDPDVRANLQYARNQVQGPSLRAAAWERWLTRLTVNEWTLLVAGSFWCALLAAAMVQIRPALKASLRLPVILLAAATVFLGVALALAWNVRRGSPGVIVTSPEAVVRNGPFTESPQVFIARDGAELKVLDHKDAWLRISAGPRYTGWIPQEHVIRILTD